MSAYQPFGAVSDMSYELCIGIFSDEKHMRFSTVLQDNKKMECLNKININKIFEK